MRKLLEQKTLDILKNAPHVAHWLLDHKTEYALLSAWAGVERSITIITDEMLLSLYTRLMLKDPIVPCLADDDGQFLNIKIGNYYGGMQFDGSVHT